MEDKLRKFDAITGEELPESVELQKAIDDESIVYESTQLDQMQKTIGWKLVLEHLEENIKYHQDALLTCDTLDALHRQQEVVKSYLSILGWIESKHHQAKTILEEKSS